MRKQKEQALGLAGWRVGSVEEFLELTPEESVVVELKLRLSDALRGRRDRLKLSQQAAAERLGSSQSRVAKMEAGDRSVSLDLLVRALVALGATRGEVVSAMRGPARAGGGPRPAQRRNSGSSVRSAGLAR